jgi:hypothetical protein
MTAQLCPVPSVFQGTQEKSGTNIPNNISIHKTIIKFHPSGFLPSGCETVQSGQQATPTFRLISLTPSLV